MEHAPDLSSKNDTHRKWLRGLAIGSALAVGAVVLAPYLLPAIGIGSTALAEESMMALHGEGLGSGLAGVVNGMLNAVPFIGAALTNGGAATAMAAGITGIGGVLLGRYIEQRDDGSNHIRWGKVVKTAALLSSALIALPSLLTGISTGIVFIAAATAGTAAATTAAGMMFNTLGSIGTASMAAAGIGGGAFVLPHLLTCGTPMIPASLAWAMNRKDANHQSTDNQEITGKYTQQLGTERLSGAFPGMAF